MIMHQTTHFWRWIEIINLSPLNKFFFVHSLRSSYTPSLCFELLWGGSIQSDSIKSEEQSSNSPTFSILTMDYTIYLLLWHSLKTFRWCFFEAISYVLRINRGFLSGECNWSKAQVQQCIMWQWHDSLKSI